MVDDLEMILKYLDELASGRVHDNSWIRTMPLVPPERKKRYIILKEHLTAANKRIQELEDWQRRAVRNMAEGGRMQEGSPKYFEWVSERAALFAEAEGGSDG